MTAISNEYINKLNSQIINLIKFKANRKWKTKYSLFAYRNNCWKF